MSPQRRRRRRRKSRRGEVAPGDQEKQAATGNEAPSRTRRGRRRRRGRASSGPRTLEEVIDALAPRPEGDLTLPEDDLDLDDIIGSLQAKWGVPVYPQEYRITIKVTDERNGAAAGKSSPRSGVERDAVRSRAAGIPREKAPGAPRIPHTDGADGADGDDGGGSRRRRRRRRRSRRGGGSGGGPRA